MWIEIDFRDKRPLYEQIASKIEEMILRGVLSKDEALPSVRSLAMELSINPNTIQKAYSTLEAEGLTYSVSGRGSFVADAGGLLPKKREEIFRELDGIMQKAKVIGLTRLELMAYIQGDVKSSPGRTKAKEESDR
ncbi:MAG: GntR family transcriptional regulator [Lachnospiraceae bacterium]|nr:GntR family transcriptional regulator [Lachnospiraceae bacterium]